MTRAFLSIVLLLSGILVSCCSTNKGSIHQQTKFEIPLNLHLKMQDTISVSIKELDLKVKTEQVIKGVKDYSIWVNGERIWFYTYNDDVFDRIRGKGENSVDLSRGNYNVLVGEADEMMLYTVSTLTWSRCTAPYIHPDIPLSGIQLLHCEENSGIITGEIKLGTNIPKYSLLKFTLVEKENEVVLKRIVLER